MAKGILWAVLVDEMTAKAALGNRYTDKVYTHHVTLRFNAEKDEFAHLLGMEFDAVVSSICWDGDIEAARVVLPEWVGALCSNAYPHMTISARAGITPVKSNEMLAGEHTTEAWNLPLRFRIEFMEFDKR